eukprot:1252477-Pyramimonas_sp.AAC.1
MQKIWAAGEVPQGQAAKGRHRRARRPQRPPAHGRGSLSAGCVDDQRPRAEAGVARAGEEEPPAQSQPPVTAAEAVRRAEGVWKQASLQYEQTSSQVQRCKDSLDKAKAREAEAIRALVTAELSRKVAAKAMAREAGV